MTEPQLQTPAPFTLDDIPVDKLKRPLKAGQMVAKASCPPWARSGILDIHEVTRIEDGRVYLDGSKTALLYPSRVLIVDGAL